MSKNDAWDKLHDEYAKQDWIDKPNIFTEEVLGFFPKSGSVLCLGDGQGQDGRFFAQQGFSVISTDISDIALDISRQKARDQNIKNMKIEYLDMVRKFPYKDKEFDVVYAYLSLHYFSEKVTLQIIKEIKRVLKRHGILAVFVNSVNDPEFNTGERIEQELFKIEDKLKRFFSVYSMEHFTHGFSVLLLDDQGKTYKDSEKGVYNLVRFVGEKI